MQQGWIKWFLPLQQSFKMKTPLHIPITSMWWFPLFSLSFPHSRTLSMPGMHNDCEMTSLPAWNHIDCIHVLEHKWRQVVLEPRVSPEHTSKYVDTVTVFAKNLNQRSLTPRWPLTPHLLRSYVWLYPRIIVSKSHENTSMWIQWPFLQKLEVKVIDP